jgi:quercetin dioxygenase-like cupin family protein
VETWHALDLELAAHHPQVLRTDAETRVVAILLPAGEQLQEHQVHERSYLVVVDGDITISQESGSVSGGTGLLAHFEPNERRTIEAVTDARLVLMLAPWPGKGHPSRAASPAA